MISTVYDLYALVEFAKQKCREFEWNDIAQRFDDALKLGTSGLEIIGQIKMIFIEEAPRLEKVVEKATIQEVIRFVNKAYGSE